jgi:hypothetical protein
MRAVARQVAVTLVDDLDGSEAMETVTFGLDGREYEIDLSEENAARLRDGLARFVGAGRRTGGGRRGGRGRAGGSGAQPSTSASDRERNAAIRQWAREHGFEVSARGRIPGPVLEAYRNEVG